MQSNTNYELSVGACCETWMHTVPIEFRDMGTFQHTPAVLIAIVITEKSRLHQVERHHIVYLFVIWHCHS